MWLLPHACTGMPGRRCAVWSEGDTPKPDEKNITNMRISFVVILEMQGLPESQNTPIFVTS